MKLPQLLGNDNVGKSVFYGSSYSLPLYFCYNAVQNFKLNLYELEQHLEAMGHFCVTVNVSSNHGGLSCFFLFHIVIEIIFDL